MINQPPPDALLISQLMIYAAELRTLYKAARYQSSELDDALKRLDELDVSKSNFVQLVSHELRTPVAVIAGYVEILDEMLGGRLVGVESGFLKTVYRQTQHLSLLVQQLTEFSQFATQDLPAQLPSSEIEIESDLAAIVRSELEAVIAAQIKPLNFELQAPQVLSLANIEPTRFRLIVRYLLSNAVKFNIDNGWVKVDLQTHSESHEATDLEVTHETQTLMLEIGNSGAVIPSDQLDAIFKSFRQVEEVTTPSSRGSGHRSNYCRAGGGFFGWAGGSAFRRDWYFFYHQIALSGLGRPAPTQTKATTDAITGIELCPRFATAL